jgi:hypothetical protein
MQTLRIHARTVYSDNVKLKIVDVRNDGTTRFEIRARCEAQGTCRITHLQIPDQQLFRELEEQELPKGGRKVRRWSSRRSN